MTEDPSRGWNAVAADFIAARSDVGAEVVRRWAGRLPPGGDVLDIGCGSGEPVAASLAAAGLKVWGVDASPALVAAFRRRLPDAQVACEPAETSAFFHRRFHGAVAIGLLFLLPAADQLRLLAGIGRDAGGNDHFDAVRQPAAPTASASA